jgi:hypothetical protein
LREGGGEEEEEGRRIKVRMGVLRRNHKDYFHTA